VADDEPRDDPAEDGPVLPKAPVIPPQAYSYGTRDVQPGYESEGPSPRREPWGRDPWAEED
jgi:hypothetical protein